MKQTLSEMVGSALILIMTLLICGGGCLAPTSLRFPDAAEVAP